MSLDRPTRSIRLLQRNITLKIVSETNVHPHLRRTKLLNSKFVYDNVIQPCSGEKLFQKLRFGLIQLIGSTLPKFDV